MHYLWPSLESFNTWHDEACVALGIPHPGFNAVTGEVDTEAQWTTAYTTAIETDRGWIAVVEDDVAAMVPDGLGEPTDPPEPEPLIAE